MIVQAFHDSPVGGHSGFPVMYCRLVSLFKWAGMKQFVHSFVRSCHICQQDKPKRSLPVGLLQPLPVPSAPWEMASMDFIDGLPPSHQFNCILVVVDKLSKFAHFIPLKHPYTAIKVAEVFLDNIYKLHGLPQSIISDRDPVFTSKFWQAIFRAIGTQLRLSTTNHPETDGQTECVNQSLECYLCCFISAHPHRWSKWLPLYEFWYNTNWHSSLGKTTFEVLYGRQPRYFGLTATSTTALADVTAWLQERSLVLASVRQHLLRMQQRMKHQADKHRSKQVFSVGDSVFLKLQPYLQSSVSRRSNHKLAFKFFRPFDVLERVGAVAYKLALSASSRVHPVFHVSQLKPCVGLGHQVLPQLPSPDDLLQVPIRVLQRRVRHQGLRTIVQVLVQWSRCTEAMATWEDLEALCQRFPRASAWGQADFQAGGIVNNLPAPPEDQEQEAKEENQVSRETRPRRNVRLPGWLAGHELGR
jgi:hypothetical protein